MASIDSLSRTTPKPTNAQALAALEAQWEATDAAAAVAAGMRADVAEAYVMSLGILPRMRLLACGWTNPGDKLRLPTDADWWRKEYAHPLWAPLWTYARQVNASGNETPWRMDTELASGDPGALSQSILSVASELVAIERLGHHICAPYIIPRVRNVLPVPNPACIGKLKAKEKKKERDDAIDERKTEKKKAAVMSLGTLVLVGVAIYSVTFHHKHGRWPWT